MQELEFLIFPGRDPGLMVMDRGQKGTEFPVFFGFLSLLFFLLDPG
jgi:hypothetical protein